MAFIEIGWASLDWFIWLSVRISGPVYVSDVRNLRVPSDTENCVTEELSADEGLCSTELL